MRVDLLRFVVTGDIDVHLQDILLQLGYAGGREGVLELGTTRSIEVLAVPGTIPFLDQPSLLLQKALPVLMWPA